jgi:hypothetical protein
MQATHMYEFKVFSTNAKLPPQKNSSMGTPPLHTTYTPFYTTK